MTRYNPNYCELTTADMAATKTFYGDILGFTFIDYGASYCAATTDAIALGIEEAQDPRPPLLTIETDDLEAALAQISASGATITVPIFAFPGGRRFQCLDPGSNEIAIFQNDPPE